ncbi:ribokinase [Nesterenkonia halotolerans]|uniref:Ribokinase n=1 Tax=Nesterenkonia halotolerans TaxID=225325 RepID=A0ABR9J569_9MICC|nr:ribokinase [Nesterenkonia halotolerans]MBE1514130.1 ribokinase [Nesterenkonia halotolerans]
MTLLVVGSVNRDITAQLTEFPQPGETVLAHAAETATGGKSANQAVAAALVGAESHLVARCGADAAGTEAVASLLEAGVQAEAVTPGRGAQGTAFITVRADGENTIVVVPGANAELSADDCPPALLDQAEWVLLSLEVPLEAVLETAARAHATGTKVALNASPLPTEAVDLRNVDMVIVNEGEAQHLLERAAQVGGGHRAEHPAESRTDYSEPARSGLADPAAQLGVETLIVTRGGEGALLHRSGQPAVDVPGVPVKAVDTSGCGDAFAGALVGRLTCGDSLETAAATASRFAADAATRFGAQSSYPRDFSVR